MRENTKKQLNIGLVKPIVLEKLQAAKIKMVKETGKIMSNGDLLEHLLENKYPELKDIGLF